MNLKPTARPNLDPLHDRALLAVRDRHLARLESVLAGTHHGPPPSLAGIHGKARTSALDDPRRCIAEQLESLAEQADALRDDWVFRPLIAGVGPYGVHFVDAILGAEVYDLDGTGNWQVKLLDQPVGTLEPPDLERHPVWRLACEAAEAFIESGVTVPFFCTPCLSSALNTIINLYGQEFLIALIADPEAARHDLQVITDLIVAMHRWYRAWIPEARLQAVAAGTRTRPPGRGHICGCSTQLVSPVLYRDFIVPCEDAVLNAYPRGGMIHLCGIHDALIPIWREMRSIRVVQLNDRASADLSRYLAELREDQIIYSLQCPDMPWQEAVRISGGRRMVLTFAPGDPEVESYRAWRREGGSAFVIDSL